MKRDVDVRRASGERAGGTCLAAPVSLPLVYLLLDTLPARYLRGTCAGRRWWALALEKHGQRGLAFQQATVHKLVAGTWGPVRKLARERYHSRRASPTARLMLNGPLKGILDFWMMA